MFKIDPHSLYASNDSVNVSRLVTFSYLFNEIIAYILKYNFKMAKFD